MDGADRRREIVERIRRDGRVAVTELSLQLETSEVTVRRDLDVLAEPDAVGGQAARLAEPEHVEPRARRERREEHVERRGSASIAPRRGGLIGVDDVGADLRVDALAARERDKDCLHARHACKSLSRVSSGGTPSA